MAFKDTFKTFFNYFEIDDSNERDDYAEQYESAGESPRMRVAASSSQQHQAPSSTPQRFQQAPVDDRRSTRRRSEDTSETSNLQRLHERQQELMAAGEQPIKKTTIDIKYPKRYEDATEIVNLLLENSSVLIDFQHMSEAQALRCLDYLDGARSVLSGNFKKVSNTMWLLTPVNVTVNVEELRSSRAHASEQEASFDFDMRR